MTKSLSIPEDLKPAFERVMASAPDELYDDMKFKQTILLHLKLGGLKLAMQHLKVSTMPYPTEFDMFKSRLSEVNNENEDPKSDSNEDQSEEEEEESV